MEKKEGKYTQDLVQCINEVPCLVQKVLELFVHCRFEITRHKESGVIMGIQHTDNGPIEWGKELPKTCRLSV